MVDPLEPHVQEHQLNMAADNRLADLQDKLGHRFANRALLVQALTHSSALSGDDARVKSYQRLEFLGDRVLGLAVARLLYETFPDVPEGHLSRALADLVRKETCAAIAADLGVGPALAMGKGEKKSGLGKKQSVLGDACEALVGAICLDAGFEAADAVIRRLWGPLMPDIGAGAGADPKTALQEWAHAQGLTEPTYRETGRTGPDHAPVFVVEAMVPGLAPAEGSGKSKRVAERAAAAAMLARETGRG